MLIPLRWLGEYVGGLPPVAEIAARLTHIGLEVERCFDPAEMMEGFVVGEVREVMPHPNADKLRLCVVFDGEREHKVVCGAGNVKEGMKGVFAPIGVRIPESGIVLGKAKIRGEESCGMLCSERELLLGDDHGGVIELPSSAKAGAGVAQYFAEAAILECAITPNRGDCLGVYGIARELAASGMGKVKPLKIVAHKGGGKPSLGVSIEGDFCSQFAFCTIRGVTNGASPDWLAGRLSAVGIAPINALVDITNYLTHAFGRPAHVYDADRVEGDIVVRPAKKGEKLTALDNKEYELALGTPLIADGKKPLGIAGIIGGVESGVEMGSKNIVLEMASFDAVAIAKAGRALMVESEARFRFERSVDPCSLESGMNLALALIGEICGGEASEVVTVGENPKAQKAISFDPALLGEVSGFKVPVEKVKSILGGLGFVVKGGKLLSVTPPSWRADIAIAEDIVEEVLRIYGIDHIASEPLPSLPFAPKSILPLWEANSFAAKKVLAARGMVEMVSWSFISEKGAGVLANGGDIEHLRLENPISSELSHMRPSLLFGIIQAGAANHARGAEEIALFEMGQVFEASAERRQSFQIAAMRFGSLVPRHWESTERGLSPIHARADAEAVLGLWGLGVEKLQILPLAPEHYHPARSGALCLGPKNPLAFFGELHPSIAKRLGAPQPAVGFELFPENIPPSRKKGTSRAPFSASKYQSVKRDFAFELDEGVEGASLVQAARNAYPKDKAMIASVSVFDVFQGGNVPKGKKSVAIEVVLRPKEHTLTEKEIDEISNAIIGAVQKKTGGKLRK